MKKRKAQIWIETVIYTLIAFVMIGLVLSFVKPKIEEVQDQAIIEQFIRTLDDINDIILSIEKAPGNQRVANLEIKKGVLKIDGADDKIVFEIESRYVYSQPGENVSYKNIIAHTQKMGKFNIVTLTSNYEGMYDLTYDNKDDIKSITHAPTPYRIIISNKGKSGTETIINMEII